MHTASSDFEVISPSGQSLPNERPWIPATGEGEARPLGPASPRRAGRGEGGVAQLERVPQPGDAGRDGG